MDNFTFYNPAKIIFGKGTENQVGKEMKKLRSHVLLVYGGGTIKRIGLYDTVVKALNAENISFVELGGVHSLIQD